MKLIICVCLLAIFQAVNSQEASNSAVKVQLTARGVRYAAFIATSLIVKEVTETQIDDISGKNFFEYSLKNIIIGHFQTHNPDISIIPGYGLKIYYPNAAFSASGKWKYKKGFVRDSGKGKVSVRSISFSLSVNIVVDSEGRPILNAHSCNINLGGFKVELSGGASYFYNLIIKVFKRKLTINIEKNICKAALNAINNNGNSQLATFNLQSEISKGLILEYFLTGPPTFTGTYLETSHKGTFLGDTEIPTIPLIETASNTMIGVSIAAETFNSAARIMFKKKLFNNEYEIDDVKYLFAKLDSRLLNTTLFANLTPLSSPRISITLGGLSVYLHAQAELFGQMPDGSTFPVMTVDLNLEASTKVEVKDEKIIIQLTKLIPKTIVKVTHNIIIPKYFLNPMLAVSIRMALPSFNKKLQRGFLLPNVEKTKYSKVSVKLLPGYISIASDIFYIP